MDPWRNSEATHQRGRTLDAGRTLTLHEFVESELDVLDARSQKIIRLRYGLPDRKPMTFREIAEALDRSIGMSRVQQLHITIKSGWL